MFFDPVFFTIMLILGLFEYSNVLLLICIGFLFVSFVIAYFLIKEVRNNPYPFHYLVDYDTLIKFMEEEEKFSFDNNLEVSFNFYLYQDKEKKLVRAWHYSSSNFEKEKAKGNVYYYDK